METTSATTTLDYHNNNQVPGNDLSDCKESILSCLSCIEDIDYSCFCLYQQSKHEKNRCSKAAERNNYNSSNNCNSNSTKLSTSSNNSLQRIQMMKWGESARRKRTKPWERDVVSTKTESVAKILGALSFENEPSPVKNRPPADNESSALEDEPTNNHNTAADVTESTAEITDCITEREEDEVKEVKHDVIPEEDDDEATEPSTTMGDDSSVQKSPQKDERFSESFVIDEKKEDERTGLHTELSETEIAASDKKEDSSNDEPQQMKELEQSSPDVEKQSETPLEKAENEETPVEEKRDENEQEEQPSIPPPPSPDMDDDDKLSPVRNAVKRFSVSPLPDDKPSSRKLDIPDLEVPVKCKASDYENGKVRNAEGNLNKSVVIEIEEGIVKAKVYGIKLTEHQMVSKKLANEAAAIAKKRIAEEAAKRAAAAALEAEIARAAEEEEIRRRKEEQEEEQRRLKEEEEEEIRRREEEEEEEMRRWEEEEAKRLAKLEEEALAGKRRAAEAMARAQMNAQPPPPPPPKDEIKSEKQLATPIRVNSFNQSTADDTAPRIVEGFGSPVMSEITEQEQRPPLPPMAPSLANRTVSFDQMSIQSDVISNFSTESANAPGGANPRRKVSDIIRRDLWHRDGNFVESSLNELTEKAAKHRSYRSAIARAGGILAIVRAMEQHTTHAGVQIAACRALEKLALDTENELAIGEVGGVDSILGAMMAHFTDSAVQEAAWSALWNCTCGNACDTMTIDTQGGMGAIVSCMKQHVDNPIVQASACGTLVNLCLENEARLTALADAGGFAAIAQAMQRHWRNTSVRNEASHAMFVLVENHAREHAAGQVDEEVEVVEDEGADEEEEIIEEEV